MPSAIHTSLKRTCPACGQGKLFSAYLKTVEHCPACGLDLKEHDAADGPATLAMWIVGIVATMLAAVVELKYEPPFWVHLAIWVPFIMGFSLALLPVLKAFMIAMHWRHRKGT